MWETDGVASAVMWMLYLDVVVKSEAVSSQVDWVPSHTVTSCGKSLKEKGTNVRNELPLKGIWTQA